MSDDELERQLRALKAHDPAPRHGFADAVMQQVVLRKRPRLGWWQRLLTPRAVTLRVRPLHAALALSAGAVALLVAYEARRPASTVAAVHHVIAPPPSPAATRVRFTLQASEASRVSVAGDFNDWRAEATPMQPAGDGLWTVTVTLRPGSWAYAFMVDGKPVEDPLAVAYRDDGFGGRNAIVRVGDEG